MYGFRVFEAWATRGPRRINRLDVADPLDDSMSLLDRVDWAVEELAATGLRTGLPDLNEPGGWVEPAAPARGDPQSLFSETELVKDGQLLVKLKYGYHGMYPEAWDRQGSVPLDRRATTNDFRALFLMPASGTEGRLVVETIGTVCPVTPLVRWLGWTEYHGDNADWVRIRVKQIADRARVLRMARDAQEVTARLVQKHPGSPGDGGGLRAKLEVREDSEIKREQLIAEALRWLETGADEEYVLRVEEIAGYDHETLDELGLRFNSASIQVVDEHGESRTFKPDSIREKFTYPVSQELQATDETWLARVWDTLGGSLSEGTDIQL